MESQAAGAEWTQSPALTAAFPGKPPPAGPWHRPRSLNDTGPEGYTGTLGSGDCCTMRGRALCSRLLLSAEQQAPSHPVLPLLGGCEGLSQAGGSGSGWQRQALPPPPAEILGTGSLLTGTSWGLARWGRRGLRDPPGRRSTRPGTPALPGGPAGFGE